MEPLIKYIIFSDSVRKTKYFEYNFVNKVVPTDLIVVGIRQAVPPRPETPTANPYYD